MDLGFPPRSQFNRRALVLVVALVALTMASCSGGGDDSAAKTTTTTVAPGVRIDIPLGDVSADSAGAPVTVSPDQSQHVLDALISYVKAATVQPLRSGQVTTAELGKVFDLTTLVSATTTDRGVVLDEGLPKITGDLTATAQPVTLVGLGDQSGNLTLISAALVLDVTGATTVEGDPLHVVRQANFVLQPDPSGVWKISSYDMVVSRAGAGLTPTTTSTTTSTSTTGVAK